jgi:hypothetical protein
MRVEFKVRPWKVHEERPPGFLKVVKMAFLEAKMLDEWGMALLIERPSLGEVIYRTCCNNIYKATADTFSYQGTREGLLKLRPFPSLQWTTVARNWAILSFIRGQTVYDYELDLIRYETTTPPEWNVEWSDSIRRILTEPDKAVIISFSGIVKRIVPYSDRPGLQAGKPSLEA